MNLLQKLVSLLINKSVEQPSDPADMTWVRAPRYKFSNYADVLAEWQKMQLDPSFDRVREVRSDLSGDEILRLYRQWQSPCICEECLSELYGEDPETFGKPL